MQATRSRDTEPELLLRSALHGLGLRYRVSARPLPELTRTADVLFRRAKVAVFVDGCFFHGCPQHYREPQANATYWANKIQKNSLRDSATTEALENAGWLVIRIWEHQDLREAARHIADRVSERLQGPA